MRNPYISMLVLALLPFRLVVAQEPEWNVTPGIYLLSHDSVRRANGDGDAVFEISPVDGEFLVELRGCFDVQGDRMILGKRFKIVVAGRTVTIPEGQSLGSAGSGEGVYHRTEVDGALSVVLCLARSAGNLRYWYTAKIVVRGQG